jgi:hypothetical protein
MVTLNRGAAQYNFTCTRLACETRPVPGDESTYFANTHGEQEKHEDMATKAAGTGSVASNAGQ